jgi:mitochondrial FAD-linked sulfhydryl oxidase
LTPIFSNLLFQPDTKSTTEPKPREDCPLDKDQLGRASWNLLHTIAAHYPDKPTPEQASTTKDFFRVLSHVYPCEHCATDMREDLKVNPPQVKSQTELSQWLCRFHNRVNVKLGKPEFDCSKVNQRWRDGWLDGSCD